MTEHRDNTPRKGEDYKAPTMCWACSRPAAQGYCREHAEEAGQLRAALAKADDERENLQEGHAREWDIEHRRADRAESKLAKAAEALDEIANGAGCTQTYSGCRDECRRTASAALAAIREEAEPACRHDWHDPPIGCGHTYCLKCGEHKP